VGGANVRRRALFAKALHVGATPGVRIRRLVREGHERVGGAVVVVSAHTRLVQRPRALLPLDRQPLFVFGTRRLIVHEPVEPVFAKNLAGGGYEFEGEAGVTVGESLFRRRGQAPQTFGPADRTGDVLKGHKTLVQ